MEATIVNYRRGLHTEYTNQFIIEIEGVKSKDEANKLAGKKVIWKTLTGKEIIGKITHAHGNNGAMLVRFEKGLPGQAIGTKLVVE